MAVSNITHELQKDVMAVSASDKYNKTLTVAAISVVYHFIRKSQVNNFKDFIEENPRLSYNFRELMGTHSKIDI